jgi:hypothetical protein
VPSFTGSKLASKEPVNGLPSGAPYQINWRGGISQKVVVWLVSIPLVAARISLTGTPVSSAVSDHYVKVAQPLQKLLTSKI